MTKDQKRLRLLVITNTFFLMLVAVIYELFIGGEETDQIERRESRYLFTISVNLQPAC